MRAGDQFFDCGRNRPPFEFDVLDQLGRIVAALAFDGHGIASVRPFGAGFKSNTGI